MSNYSQYKDSASTSEWYAELGKPPHFHFVDGGLLALLTPLQRKVLELVAAGHATKQIAEQLKIDTGVSRSDKTIPDYIETIYRKLGCKENRSELVRIAIENKIPTYASTRSLNDLIDAYKTLRPREKEAFLLSAKGYQKKEIGTMMGGICYHTVAEYIANINHAFGVSTAAERASVWFTLKIEADRLWKETEAARKAAEETAAAASPITAGTEAPNSQINGSTTISYGTHQYAVSPESAAGSFTDRLAIRHPSLDRRWR